MCPIDQKYILLYFINGRNNFSILEQKGIKITTPIRISVFVDLFHSTIEFFENVNFFHIFVIFLQSNYYRNRSKLFHATQ